MNEQEFSIVLALARCAMAHPTDAIRHQIKRLVDLETQQGNAKHAEYLAVVLREDTPHIGKIERSETREMRNGMSEFLGR